MGQALLSVVIGLVLFVVVDELVSTLITGTDTGSVIFQDVVPLAVAVGCVVGALKHYLGGKHIGAKE